MLDFTVIRPSLRVGVASGDAAAEARIQTLREQELRDEGITADIAEGWRLFFLGVIKETPSNPSAEGRALLMQHARTLLE